jgi:hypothetical protein
MKKVVFNLDEARKKQLQIVLYLVGSGVVGYLLAWLVGKPELTAIFAPALNYIAYQIELEIKKEGISRIIEAKKK